MRSGKIIAAFNADIRGNNDKSWMRGLDWLLEHRILPQGGLAVTAMLASVTGPEEAEIAIAGGADIIDMKDPSAGAFGSLPIARIEETLAAIDLRRPTSAVTGDPAMRARGSRRCGQRESRRPASTT